MADLSQAIVLFVVLLALLASGVWVALVLIACGILSIFLYADAPAGIIFATKAWDSSASWALTALPLFIWMGEILYRTRLAEDMFSGLGPWVQRLPVVWYTSIPWVAAFLPRSAVRRRPRQPRLAVFLCLN